MIKRFFSTLVWIAAVFTPGALAAYMFGATDMGYSSPYAELSVVAAGVLCLGMYFFRTLNFGLDTGGHVIFNMYCYVALVVLLLGLILQANHPTMSASQFNGLKLSAIIVVSGFLGNLVLMAAAFLALLFTKKQ